VTVTGPTTKSKLVTATTMGINAGGVSSAGIGIGFRMSVLVLFFV